jgi:glycosyltransferase involved in cell wall biosynthesis
LFVFASRTETQGLVLLEALAQGTPVVSTMHMGTRDVLEHARGAQIVDEDLAQFSGAVVALLSNPTRRQQLAAVAPMDATKWSAREMAERLIRCYVATTNTQMVAPLTAKSTFEL